MRHVVLASASTIISGKAMAGHGNLVDWLDSLESVAEGVFDGGPTTSLFKEGWVLNSDFLASSRAEIPTLLEPKRETGKDDQEKPKK